MVKPHVLEEDSKISIWEKKDIWTTFWETMYKVVNRWILWCCLTTTASCILPVLCIMIVWPSWSQVMILCILPCCLAWFYLHSFWLFLWLPMAFCALCSKPATRVCPTSVFKVCEGLCSVSMIPPFSVHFLPCSELHNPCH